MYFFSGFLNLGLYIIISSVRDTLIVLRDETGTSQGFLHLQMASYHECADEHTVQNDCP